LAPLWKKNGHKQDIFLLVAALQRVVNNRKSRV